MKSGQGMGLARMPSATAVRGWMGMLVGKDGKAALVLFPASRSGTRPVRLSAGRLRAVVG